MGWTNLSFMRLETYITMNTRRQFFGNLFKGIVVAGAAPSVIVSRFGDRQIWKPSRKIITMQLETVPIVTLELTTSPIVARTRKLKTDWTVEMEHDFNVYHSIGADTDLVRILSRKNQNEIDQDIVNRIRNMV